MNEIWKQIKGYPNHEISNLGNVRSFKNGSHGLRSIPKNLKTFLFEGYPRINLEGATLKIHRLVAEAFILNPENKPEVNHINGIKSDNRPENLEWCTRQENISHAWNNGLKKSSDLPRWKGNKDRIAKVARGENQGNHLLTEKMVRVIKHALSFNVRGTSKWLAKMCGTSIQNINRIKIGKSWNHVTV